MPILHPSPSLLAVADLQGVGRPRAATSGPEGDHEAKVAISETWNASCGADGVRNGTDILVPVGAATSTITFSFVSATAILTVTTMPAPVEALSYE